MPNTKKKLKNVPARHPHPSLILKTGSLQRSLKRKRQVSKKRMMMMNKAMRLEMTLLNDNLLPFSIFITSSLISDFLCNPFPKLEHIDFNVIWFATGL